MTTKRLIAPSIFFFIFNGVGGGIFYTWLKFTALGHSDGTGVTPGPWLVLPLLSFIVLAISTAIAAIVYVIFNKNDKAKHKSFIKILLMSFIGSSVMFHLWYIVTAVLVPDLYT